MSEQTKTAAVKAWLTERGPSALSQPEQFQAAIAQAAAGYSWTIAENMDEHGAVQAGLITVTIGTLNTPAPLGVLKATAAAAEARRPIGTTIRVVPPHG